MKKIILLVTVILIGIFEVNADRYVITGISTPKITINGTSYRVGDTIDIKDLTGRIAWIDNKQVMEVKNLTNRKLYHLSRKNFESGSSYLRYLKKTTRASIAGNLIGGLSAEECYSKGKKYYVLDNVEMALEWYHKAAEKGSAEAKYILGNMYEHGVGVPQDSIKALRWYLRAAKQGNKDAKKAIERINAQ